MDNHRNAPATKADLEELRSANKADLGELRAELKEGKAQLRSEMQLMHDEIVERIRDCETKLLQAFYSFAESNQKRVSSVEEETAAIKSRLATVEERLTGVEKRLNMPPTR